MIKGSFDIRANVEKNRLYITLQEYFTDDLAKNAADKVVEECKKLKPGFSVINDISNFKPASQQGAEDIKRAQAELVKCNVGRVIRIIRNENILTHLQFDRKSTEAGYQEKANIATSIPEAEKLLDREGK